MMVKGYSCENCIHKAICCYKKDMIELWNKIQSIQSINNNLYPFGFKNDLSLPSVGYYSLKCECFKE